MIVSRRHKKLGLTTRVFKRIEDIPPDDWKIVFPEILEGYDFFKSLDESDFPQFSFYYIMVYERRAPVGAAPCFFMDYPLDTSISGPLRRISNSIKRRMPNIFSLKAFICGTPVCRGRIGISRDSGEVMRVILRRMEQLARKKRAQVVAFKDFDASYTRLLDPLMREGFSRFDSLPTTELDVRYQNFEEYLKTLSGASRYDLRRKFRHVDGHVKIETEVVNSVDDDTLSEIYRLYLQMLDRHDMGFEVLPMEFFKNVAKNMPDRTKFFLMKVEGRLVAFLFCLVSDEHLIDYYLGLDYSVAHRYHLYFVKFRYVLNWCIENRIKKYEMGVTGYEAKRRLKFDFVPLYIYARLRSRVFRPVFRFFCQFLKFENFDPSLRQARRKRSEE